MFPIMQVVLGLQHRPTGRTRHFRNAVLLPVPASLRIAQFPGDTGYYLLYLDSHGNEMTDTHHESVEAAMAQASFEFNVRPEEWVNTGA